MLYVLNEQYDRSVYLYEAIEKLSKEFQQALHPHFLGAVHLVPQTRREDLFMRASRLNFWPSGATRTSSFLGPTRGIVQLLK